MYQDQVAEYDALPAEERMSVRAANILSNTDFEMLDIHLYDDYQDWESHLLALRTAGENAGAGSDLPVIVSEFGGPYPKDLYGLFGIPVWNLLAERLISYVHTLDSLDVEEVYFFQASTGQFRYCPP